MPRVLTRETKLILTGFINFTYIIYGLGFSVWGPTLPDTVRLIKSTTDEASYGFVARQIFYGSSAILFGYLFKLFDRRYALVIALIGCAGSMFVLPLCRSFVEYLFVNIAFAITGVAAELVLNSWLLEMWKQDSNLYMQAMHFCYALGSVFGPLISGPFLSEPVVPNSTLTELTTLSNGITTTIEPEITTDEYIMFTPSRIEIPYYISAVLFLLVAAMHFVLKLLIPYDQENNNTQTTHGPLDTNDGNNKQMEEKSKANVFDSDGSNQDSFTETSQRRYYLMVIPIAALLLGFEGSIEQSTFTYLQTFAEKIKLQLQPHRAAFLNSVLNGMFTLSRFLAIFLAMKIKTGTMIILDISVITLGTILIALFADTWEPGLWIGVAIMGFLFSSCWPGIFAYVEERIRVNDLIAGIFMFGTALNSAIAAYLVGKFIEHSPKVFSVFNVISAFGCVALFGALCYTNRFRNRH